MTGVYKGKFYTEIQPNGERFLKFEYTTINKKLTSEKSYFFTDIKIKQMRILFNKPLIAILFFITNHCTKLEAQTPCSDCDQKNIVTDPRPGKTENCENPSKKNKFFWFPYNGTNNNTFNAYYSYPGGNIIGTINNPFWSISPGPIIGTHAGQQYSDFNQKMVGRS